MANFEKGNVVKLKSGGPAMTVERVGDFNYRGVDYVGGVVCVWFHDREAHRDAFDTAALELRK